MYTTPMLPSYNTRLVASKDLPKGLQRIFFNHDGKASSVSIRRISSGTQTCVRFGEPKERESFSPAWQRQEVMLRQGRALLTELLGAGEFTILINNYLAECFAG